MILDEHSLCRMARGLRQEANDATARAQAIIADWSSAEARRKAKLLALASSCLAGATSLEDIATQMRAGLAGNERQDLAA